MAGEDVILAGGMREERLSWSRRLLYGLVVCAFVLAFMELVLALTGLVGVFAPFSCSEEGGERRCDYRFKPGVGGIRVPKEADTFRIVLVGGSAVNGYPFSAAGFPETLCAMLSALEPGGKRYEVINLGVNGVNTSFVVELLREAVPLLGPDLVVVYAGNNELLARESIDDLSHPRLKRAIWWMRRHSRVWNLPSYVAGFFLVRGFAVGLMLRITHLEETPGRWLNPPLAREHARRLYLGHLEEMIRICRAHRTRIVLCTPGSNLRDWIPMKSTPSAGLSPETLAANQARIKKARKLLMAGRPAQALGLLKEVTRLDPGYAKGWFFQGRAELLLGDEAQGRRHLEEAVEKADFFQQVPPSWNQGVRELARTHQVALVDVDQGLRKLSPQGVPGFDLFVDGCHPTLKGHYLIARMLLQELWQKGLLGAPWSEDCLEGLPGREELLERVCPRRQGLGMAFFNQAMVLAFLYPHLEYKPVAVSYLEEAKRLGVSPGLCAPFQGYVEIMLDQPLKAAAYFSEGRREAPELFSSVIKNKLGMVAVLQDPWLWFRKVDEEEAGLLYPSSRVREWSPPDILSCHYRFSWDGEAYHFAPVQ